MKESVTLRVIPCNVITNGNPKPHIILCSMTLFIVLCKRTVIELNEFEARLKFLQNRFQLNAGLNLEKLNTILSRGLNSNSLNSASELLTQTLIFIFYRTI